MNRVAANIAALALLALCATAQAKGPELPRAVSPAELSAMLTKPEPGIEIVDIRPAAEFADYTLPGAQNADAVTLLADPAYLSGSGPLVLLDKEGATAMALGGVLSQTSSRPIVVLKGGLAAWWAERELGQVAKETPLQAAPVVKGAPGAAPSPAAPSSSPPSPGDSAPQAPQPPAAKNAGC